MRKASNQLKIDPIDIVQKVFRFRFIGNNKKKFIDIDPVMEKPGCCLYYSYNYNVNHYIYGAVAGTGSAAAAADAHSSVNN